MPKRNVGLTPWEFCKTKEDIPVSLKAQQFTMTRKSQKMPPVVSQELGFLFANFPNYAPPVVLGGRPLWLVVVGGGWSDNLCFGVQWS